MWQDQQQEAEHAMALWQDAMGAQRLAQEELESAQRANHAPAVQALSSKVERLRYRADLLLASAVRASLDASS